MNNKNINDIVFIISARVNSTRVINKMTRNIGNTTLFDIAIKKLLNSNLIPKKNIYVAIGDKELIDIAKKYDVNIFYRTKESINCDGTELFKIWEWCKDKDFLKKYKYYFQLNACQPFIKIDTINKFINKFLKSDNRSIISVNKFKNYFWKEDKTLYLNNIAEHEIKRKGIYFNTRYVKELYTASHTLQIGNLDDLSKWIMVRYI